MPQSIGDVVEYSATVMALIERARQEGLDTEKYDELMEKGLADEQKEVAKHRAGEGRIRLNGQRPQTDDGGVEIPNMIDKLVEGKKIPWIVTLDGVDFVVKTSFGEGSYPHSRWTWHEDGFRFTFFKSRTEDTVDSLSIKEV